MKVGIVMFHDSRSSVTVRLDAMICLAGGIEGAVYILRESAPEHGMVR